MQTTRDFDCCATQTPRRVGVSTYVRIDTTTPDGQPVTVRWDTDMTDLYEFTTCALFARAGGRPLLQYWRHGEDTIPDWVPRPDLVAIAATGRYLRGDLS